MFAASLATVSVTTVYLACAYTAGVVFAALIFLVLWVVVPHLRFVAYHRNRVPAPAPLAPAAILRYYRRTLFATLIIGWWAVRAAGRDGLRMPAGAATGPPVLCVHGFLRNGTCTWGIRRTLERHGRPGLAVSMGRPWQTIERYALPLEAALRELATSFPGQAIDVVAHSMGGVVLRQVLAEHPRLAAAVGRIVTLGSPHRGTAALRGMAFAPEHRQLEPGSAFLEQLPDFWMSAPGAAVTTIAAERDFIVYPNSTSHLPASPGGGQTGAARAIDLPDTNHQGLLTESEVLELVAELLTWPGTEKTNRVLPAPP